MFRVLGFRVFRASTSQVLGFRVKHDNQEGLKVRGGEGGGA